ncbi:ras GTPase-activating protein ngap-like isoform x9 [Plakobranchus ocellatus]|uniref:Ras GTPase-activating protein ngap-like isoform x9 n=1 Tax=Plakobranchus ocellatus TaxID=259542 RepID=A0AAV4DXK2_9GAST|nr:ras GTPase-activating protein ngap-like isoform x9 [Plakobranchus ocellatus]
MNLPSGSFIASLINARIRSSRSHESLLSSPPSMHSIDLSAPGVEVKPLHSSVLGQGHCFEVATPQGRKYFSCTTSEERDKWLSSIRRTIRPNEEHCKRSDSSLKLWILEVKNVPPKKSYFCEILLDKHLYAQTSAKTMTDMLFWGEHFEFKNLPVVETITINLYREADKKKKNKDKTLLIGYINMSLAELKNRELAEKWITCNSAIVGKAGKDQKSDLPIIRVKSRRQTVEILPLDAYQSFIQYLTTDYRGLCSLLEPLLAVKEKEDFATSLVHILQKQEKACAFLSDVVMEEISRLDDEHLTFRGNSIATKAMEAYMKLVGEKYLQDTLGEFIRDLIKSTDDCEVDPAKVATPQLLSCQQKNLDMYSNMAWVKVINSFCYFPNELREVFASLRSHCSDRGKADYSDNLISGCIFLRFLCPAILSPSLFNLTQEYPNERASRNLTLIAKTIQTLANFTQFGSKEEFMTFMNVFVEREAPNMKIFLHKISSRDTGNQFLEFDGCIDLGKELSVLHCLLTECKSKYPEQTSKPEYEKVTSILTSLTTALKDPNVGQKKPESSSGDKTTTSNNRKSQIYDNLMHVITTSSTTTSTNSKPLESGSRGVVPPSRIGYVIPTARGGNSSHTNSTQPVTMTASSPTEVLIDMLRQCGESAEDLPALAERYRQAENERSRTGTPTTALSSSNASLNSLGRKASAGSISAVTGASTNVASLINKLNNSSAAASARGEDRFTLKSSASRNMSLNAVPPAPQQGRGQAGRSGRRRSSQEERRGREADVNVEDSWSHVPGETGSNQSRGDGPYHPHGDYIDLIPFMDDMASQAAVEGNTSGSQISIGPISTAASSGYHSLGRRSQPSQPPSQADSPVITMSASRQSPAASRRAPNSGSKQHRLELTRELARSPIIHYQPPQEESQQPLAFANPLFKHQQQQHQSGGRPGTGEVATHRGMALSHAHTIQRVSSDSSISSNDEVDNTTANRHRKGSNNTSLTGTGDGKGPSVTVGYSSTVASLKKLSQLPTSSSEDSLDEGGGRRGGGSGGGGGSKSVSTQDGGRYTSSGQTVSSHYRHQYRHQYGEVPASADTSMTPSAISGCSTFPRRHHRNNPSTTITNSSSNSSSNSTKNSRPTSGSNNSSNVNPPLPPREALPTKPAWKPASSNVPGLDFQRQVSSPGPSTTTLQSGRTLPNRAHLTTNKAGYVQRTAARQGRRDSSTTNPADSSSSSRTNKNSNSVSNSKPSGKSPTSQRRLLTSSIASSLTSTTDSTNSTTNTAPSWQVATRLKRSSSSSQGTMTDTSSGNNNSSSSNSEASSPQSLMRSSSAQHTTTSGSMQESSSAHSLGHSWGSLGPDDTPTTNTASAFPARSDSSGSISSLPRGHQQARGWSQVPHSDSSGSLTGRHIDSNFSTLPGVTGTSNNNFNTRTSTTTAHQQHQQQNHSNNNNIETSTSQLDNRGNGLSSLPSSTQSRLPTVTDSHISATSSLPQPPSFLTSKYAVVHPNTAHASPTGGVSTSSSSTDPPSKSEAELGLSHKLDLDSLKRASTDSILSSGSGGGQIVSPTGSAPGMVREDSSQSICSSTGSTTSGGTRRLSPQSTVHMGISSVQRKLQEQERTKLEYEQEVHVLRQQLLEAQGRLQNAEVRLLDHELETHRLMEEWQSRLAESQEQMRRQQQEKDGQMVTFMQRLQSIEEELKREQAEMASAVEHKQQVIEAQEQRIRRLDQANARLVQALAELRGQAARGGAAEEATGNGVLIEASSCNGRQEVAGFKTSSC